jgi:hypothetical protein
MTLDDQGVETDESLRTRIANAYGMWGAFLSHVIECSGKRLDECAKHVGVERGKP